MHYLSLPSENPDRGFASNSSARRSCFPEGSGDNVGRLGDGSQLPPLSTVVVLQVGVATRRPSFACVTDVGLMRVSSATRVLMQNGPDSGNCESSDKGFIGRRVWAQRSRTDPGDGA